MNSDHAIVTLALGPRSRAVLALTSPSIADYAKRCGSEFVVIEQPKLNLGDAKFEKLQLYDLLSRYARILFVDADVIVSPRCPNLFEFVDSSRFGAYFDSNGGNGDADIPDARLDEIETYQQEFGRIGWTQHYFNSGVMVVSGIHQSIFDYRCVPRRSKRFIDQTFLNYRLQCSGLGWQDIGPSFNHFVALSRSERMWNTRFDHFIIHYAGFADFYPELRLETQIAADMDRIFG